MLLKYFQIYFSETCSKVVPAVSRLRCQHGLGFLHRLLQCFKGRHATATGEGGKSVTRRPVVSVALFRFYPKWVHGCIKWIKEMSTTLSFNSTFAAGLQVKSIQCQYFPLTSHSTCWERKGKQLCGDSGG